MRKLLLCAITTISMLTAGRYPHQPDILNIPDATDLAARIGACPGGMQGVLIAPRVIATVTHGGLNADIATQGPITIRGQNYTIIRKVEEGGLGNRDLTLWFLDRPVEDIDIQPILKLGIGQIIPPNSLLHAISIVSNNIMLGRRFEPGAPISIAANDAEHVLPYGLSIPHYGALNNLTLRENFDCLSVNNNGVAPSHFIPTGGDSGSPCFISTRDNRLATVGVVSTVDNGSAASYTYIGRYLDWIQDVILRHYAAENLNDFVIQTVDALQCNFNAALLQLESVRQRVEHLIENDPTVKIRQFEHLTTRLTELKAALATDPNNEHQRWLVHHTEHSIATLQIPVYEAIEKVVPVLRATAAEDPNNPDKAWIVHHRTSQLNVLRPRVLEKLETQLNEMIWARDNEQNQTQVRREYLQWIPHHLKSRIEELKKQMN
jgi:regulator of replication initiation timing